jgi:hypothetical protein
VPKVPTGTIKSERSDKVFQAIGIYSKVRCKTGSLRNDTPQSESRLGTLKFPRYISSSENSILNATLEPA